VPYIKRHLEEVILRLSKTYSALLVTGPRQAGKTTMLQALSEKEELERGYVTLDDLDSRALAKSDPKLFLQLHPAPLLIDEVQYAPELFSYIKIAVDTNKRPGDYWMTGSQIFRLMQGVQESLAGRVALLHLSPLSQREIEGLENRVFRPDIDTLLKEVEESSTKKQLSAHEYYTRIWRGCMPGLISERYDDSNVYYSAYVSTYIERDVRDLVNVVDALKFKNFIVSAAARVGQLLNYQSLAQDADISQATAKSWISILETLGLVYLLRPYSNNTLSRLIKTPKLYFYDTGLVCYLTKWSNPEVMMAGAMSGALLENFAVTEILKTWQNAGQEPPVYFYRDREAREIDLLLEEDGGLFPLEIKKTMSPDPRLAKVFRVIDKTPYKRGTGGVLCLAETLTALSRDCLVIPIGMI
jgi:predicted AAA+ superfamily ATPase